MLKTHRRNARKVAKLARALAALDANARLVRPEPKRLARASLSA
jgi:hypothetical protein